MGEDHYTVYDEKEVLDELLKSSDCFKLYYGSKRMNIRKRIYWAFDLSIPYGINAAITRYETGERVIRLRRIPAELEDAFTVAHELEHLVLDEEGFITTFSKEEKYETLSFTLNDILLDPLVNDRLEAYGFDLKGNFNKQWDEALKQVKGLQRHQQDNMIYTQWVFQLAEMMLEYEVAYKSEPEGLFTGNIFELRYKRLVKDAKRLTGFIKEKGFKTPAKQREIVLQLLCKYNLKKHICM